MVSAAVGLTLSALPAPERAPEGPLAPREDPEELFR